MLFLMQWDIYLERLPCYGMGEDHNRKTYENKGEEMEYKFAMTMKVEKPVFNSQDYGSIGLCLAELVPIGRT